jgi:hypothetical protein
MNYPSAIVISAGLIAGALILNGQVQGQTPAAVGRFSVAASGPSNAWRLDTETGWLVHCFFPQTVPSPRVVCGTVQTPPRPGTPAKP